MRYRNDDWTKPWPLTARLWEAKIGLGLGLLIGAIFCAPIFCLAWFLKHRLGLHGQILNLASDPIMLAVIVIGAGWTMFERELEVLKQQSISFEEMVLERLGRLERRARGQQ